METTKIFTNDSCIGCNLCVINCPCNEANVAQMENGKNKIYVDETKCIGCGECIKNCTKGARDYTDDTDRFLADLEAGKKIPLVVAPALRSNVPQWPKLLGYLKSAGVNVIYDVSFGADITTWAYLRYIEETKSEGLIAQPCPAIVNYIEMYVPELLYRLAPIHSPALCAAVYMSKYKNIPGPYAFLSPCIAKRDEFNDANTGGLIDYNVTFKRILEALEKRGIDYLQSSPAEYDNQAHGLGAIYASPGGLKANVEQHVQGEWIFQVEGQPHASHFLHEYVKERGDNPLLVDILSCEKGCSIGPGACRKHEDAYAVSKAMHNVQKETMQNKMCGDRPPGPDFAKFDKELNLADFKRKYTSRKITQMFVDRIEMEEAFAALHKPSHEYRTVDCQYCGYATCQQMAVAVAKGINHVGNCVEYLRSVLGNLKESGGAQ